MCTSHTPHTLSLYLAKKLFVSKTSLVEELDDKEQRWPIVFVDTGSCAIPTKMHLHKGVPLPERKQQKKA